LNFSFDSKLKVQNVTSSSTNDSSEDVNANPLVGKLYSQNKSQLNGFEPTIDKTSDNLGGIYNFCADPERGYFEVLAYLAVNLRKPPPPWMFNAKKSIAITLNPGHIKYSHITFKQKFTLATFVTKFTDAWRSIVRNDPDVTAIRMNFGFAEMFGFEKLVDDRVETNRVEVAYEVNRITGVFFTEKRKAYSIGDFDAITQNNVT